jgi:ABC-type transport system involved in cytochrome bd biosynthesis fused ATPase/permease subunit
MDGLFELLAHLLLHWRVGLPAFVALVLAIFFAFTVAWFTGWHGILLILFAFGAGLLWEGQNSKHG